ncbi:testis-specific serine/threonine-protein kinase 1-like [Saccoglossus kowalevskii]|uniref:Testis-specific serine/threonine-protein kinase 1-like n=1 Tax=Saccoglossus kowalevskii TaxID=10224 RepID=A0ABM0GUN9_SACKO|nr:PREDICTED: testis-specific serine/threonine-protein kinase 1-like [Saccoglossus kowalevskii]
MERRPFQRTPSSNNLPFLNGYRFTDEKLGMGAYSVVQRAYSDKLSEYVAVKVTDELKEPGEFVKNSVPKEVTILQRLNHEHIVDIYDYFQQGYKYFTVLALAEAGNLDSYIKRKIRLQEKEANNLFRQILRAVYHCHNTAKVAHGDISCTNVLLYDNNYIKLCDFGMAIELDKSDRLLHTSYSGTHGYAAPEILDGQPYDPRFADIWALGVLLFYMVTGNFPFNISNGLEGLRSDMDNPPRWPRPLNRISKPCRDLIKSMLTVNVEHRIHLSGIWESEWMTSY